MTVKKVGEEAIPIIRELAEVIWPATYSPILSQDQLSYMMQLIYSTGSLQKQIQRGHQFIIISDSTEPIGFASYSVKDDTDPSRYKLHKIYIRPNEQGKGVGKILLDFILNDIRAKGATDLELNVNRHNKAKGFYEKLGFSIIAEEDIDIGNGYFMNDHVMGHKL